MKAPPLPACDEGGEGLRCSSSSCIDEVFRGDPVTDILSLSNPASMLLSLSLVVVVKGGDVVKEWWAKPTDVVVGDPSGLVVL